MSAIFFVFFVKGREVIPVDRIVLQQDEGLLRPPGGQVDDVRQRPRLPLAPD